MLNKISQKEQILKQQTVLKLGGIARNFAFTRENKDVTGTNRWDKRYLVLTEKNLYWLEDRMSGKVQNELSLGDIVRIVKCDNQLQQSYVFRLYSRKKNYVFAITTEEQRDDWLGLIQKLTQLTLETATG